MAQGDELVGWWEERTGLAGTVGVVLGGAGGIGAAVARDLAAIGARVAVVDRDAAACARMGEELGRDALVMEGDVRDPDRVEELFAEVDGRWGRLDTLVNVAGGTFRSAFEETNRKGWDALLRANLSYIFHSCSLAIPRMRAGGRGGSIVNLTSIEAHRAAPNFAVYTAAKAGVERFSQSLAVELAPVGIRVNNVAPDMTPTEGLAHGMDIASALGDRRAVSLAVPMGRTGAPSEVSSCVIFLASQLSSYVTGTTLHPDGGTLASSGWFNWPAEGFLPTAPTYVTDRLPEVDGPVG